MQPARDMVGQTLGSYRIVSRIGAGGMGEVFRAEHTLLGSDAAIKVLRTQYSDKDEAVTRFFNEAKASTKIRHPGIVQIFDYGFHSDESAYIVMELLEGETLRARLEREGRIPVDETLRIVKHCASALSAAHKVGIVHRDFKPENVFLVPDPQVDGGERAKLLDFGIAKLSDDIDDSGIVTRTGNLLGTPVYMSPEQCRGYGPITHHTDIYSLGCVIFHMVCGRPPFLRPGAGELISCHLRESPPDASFFAPELPKTLEAVIARCLAKVPEHRFDSMSDLADALMGVGDTVSITSPELSQERSAQDARPPVHTPPGALPIAHLMLPEREAPPERLGTAPTVSVDGMQATPRKSSRTLWIALASAIGVIAAIAVFVLISGDKADASSDSRAVASADDDQAPTDEPTARDTPDQPAPPARPEIAVLIESDPPGADVYRPHSDTPIGQTPYEYRAPAQSGPVTVTLSLDGYESTELSFDGDANDTARVALKPRASKRRGDRAGRKTGAGSSRSNPDKTKTGGGKDGKGDGKNDGKQDGQPTDDDDALLYR